MFQRSMGKSLTPLYLSSMSTYIITTGPFSDYFSLMLYKPHRRLNNLKKSLRFPYLCLAEPHHSFCRSVQFHEKLHTHYRMYGCHFPCAHPNVLARWGDLFICEGRLLCFTEEIQRLLEPRLSHCRGEVGFGSNVDGITLSPPLIRYGTLRHGLIKKRADNCIKVERMSTAAGLDWPQTPVINISQLKKKSIIFYSRPKSHHSDIRRDVKFVWLILCVKFCTFCANYHLYHISQIPNL